MSDEAPPEPDRAPNAPHPRHTLRLLGQDAPVASFLEAFNSGRLHHGWLITGPRGVGKATLAWAIARFLIANPPDEGAMFTSTPATSLEIDPGHPVAHRIGALSEPGLFLLRRAWDDKARPPRLRAQITVDEVRKLRNFFALSAAGGGRRVVIIDAADEMNANAANALLKLLEEPPENAILLLVAHQPMRLLPTIRSRCRELRLSPLGADDLAAALAQAGIEGASDPALLVLADGSVGEALRLAALGGPEIYARLVEMLSGAPHYDRSIALALANEVAPKAAAEKLHLTLRLIQTLLLRLARTGAGMAPVEAAAPDEAALLVRLAPHPHAARRWAALEQELTARATHAIAVNLDPGALILDMVFRINETAAELAA